MGSLTLIVLGLVLGLVAAVLSAYGWVVAAALLIAAAIVHEGLVRGRGDPTHVDR